MALEYKCECGEIIPLTNYAISEIEMWLDINIGEEEIEWTWDNSPTIEGDIINRFSFKTEEQRALFELTWL